MDATDCNIEVVFRCKLCKEEATSRKAIRRHINGSHCVPSSTESGMEIPYCQPSATSNAKTSTIEISIILDDDDAPRSFLNTQGRHPFPNDTVDIESEVCDHDNSAKIRANGHTTWATSSRKHSIYSSDKSVDKPTVIITDEVSMRAVRPDGFDNNETFVTFANSDLPTAVSAAEQGFVESRIPVCNLLKCTFCDYTHINRTAINSHISTHNTKSVKCTGCEATFCNKQAFNNHWRLHHLGGEHLCDACGFKAQSKFALFQHKLRCLTSNFKCPQCEFTTDNIVDLNEHKTMRHSDRFSCKRCDNKYTFDTKKNMLSHMEEYHPGKSCYFCDKCNFVAKLPNQLRKHYMMHTNERPSKCATQGCQFSTRNATYLKYHIAKVHNNDKYICKQCCYVASNQEQLDLHTSLHHMKIYKCIKCNFEGKSTTALRRHCLRKHVESSEMRFKCTKCDYCTQFRDCINKHLLTHEISDSRHRCVFCKVVLRCREELKEHLVESHPDQADKVRFCDKCPYSSARSSNFNVHASRKHSFIKPFKCSLCDYSSKCKASMKLHNSRKHKAIGAVTL